MNLCIIIGVSDYKDSSNNLPACSNDIDLVQSIINAAGKYDEVLVIKGANDTISSNLKEKITGFIGKFKGKNIEELFFYYTGHGEYFNDDFYYILSDFDSGKRHQTSLENSELDVLLKSLQPDLIVKIVDACESGVQYIKSRDILKSYLEKSSGTFKQCYFMFSSRKDQSSYQDNKLSFFTKNFIDSILLNAAEEVRYKDIIDYISDQFEGNPEQTPYFIIQAAFTELFCKKNPEFAEIQNSEIYKGYDKSYTIDIVTDGVEKPQESHITLIDLIKKDAANYKNKEVILAKLSELKTAIERHVFSKEITELLDLNPGFDLFGQTIPKQKEIGKWLKEHENDYFAEVVYEQEEYQTFDIFFGRNRTTYRTVISGFHLTSSTPFNIITINAHPKLPNISRFNLTIILMFSRKDIRLFYFFTAYKEIDWDSYELNNDFEWKTISTNPDNLVDTVIKVIVKFDEYIIKEVTELFKNCGN